MFGERATAASRSLSSVTDFSKQWGQGELLVYAGALSQRSSEHSTTHTKGMITGIQPPAFSSSSPLQYDCSFPVTTTNVMPQISAVKADDWCRASLQAHPRRRQSWIPYSGSQRGAAATLTSHQLFLREQSYTGLCTPEEGGRWKRWAFTLGSSLDL